MRVSPFLLLLVPSLVLADEIHLKGAGSLSGRIIEETETTVTIDLGGGTVGVPMERVERIERKRSPLDDYDERAAKLGPQDVNGWLKLGRWASQQGLSAQAGEAYDTVLAIDPDNEEARIALGYVLLDGRWMTEEESYRAQGYVKHDGEWVTPGEAQLLQASAAAEQAARDAERRAIDAEVAALEAQRRAEEAEEAARDAHSTQYYDPLYWGGWGYGVTYWPATPSRPNRPAQPNRPTQLPARAPAGGRR